MQVIKDIYIVGQPDFNALTKLEKRILLHPLIRTIRRFYEDSANRQAFEEWKQNKKEVPCVKDKEKEPMYHFLDGETLAQL